MPTIQIDISSTAELNRAVDAICTRFNYQATIVNGGGQNQPNPETKNQFAKRQTALWVKAIVAEVEGNAAANSAKATAVASANAMAIT